MAKTCYFVPESGQNFHGQNVLAKTSMAKTSVHHEKGSKTHLNLVLTDAVQSRPAYLGPRFFLYVYRLYF